VRLNNGAPQVGFNQPTGGTAFPGPPAKRFHAYNAGLIFLVKAFSFAHKNKVVIPNGWIEFFGTGKSGLFGRMERIGCNIK
jgi:hypothetical protein